MIASYQAASGIDVLTSTFPVPGFGVVPINAFVLHGPEPVLVDTGPIVEREEFMTALRSVIDPADLRWIWLTHTDFDHIGALPQLLAENPQLRILTTFLSMGIMSLSAPLPIHRVHLINPGQKITVGDRTLTAVKPPVFDNPATTGFHDDKSGALFSSDCFGALLQAAPQGRRCRLGQGTERHPRHGSRPGPEQPSAGRPRQHDGEAAGLSGGRPSCSALRRTRPGGARSNVGPDDRAAVAPASAPTAACAWAEPLWVHQPTATTLHRWKRDMTGRGRP